jgi:type IV pilus assembly protein PilP
MQKTDLLVLVLVAAVAACSERPSLQPPLAALSLPGAAGAAAALPSAEPSSTAAIAAPPVEEADFAGLRDPFVPPSPEPIVEKPAQREVLSPDSALDELTLAGVMSGAVPRGLLVDKTGMGWVVKVGDFVGKAETVRAPGVSAEEVSVHWRVERIREKDLVLVREDASRSWLTPKTRVVALHSKQAR